MEFLIAAPIPEFHIEIINESNFILKSFVVQKERTEFDFLPFLALRRYNRLAWFLHYSIVKRLKPAESSGCMIRDADMIIRRGVVNEKSSNSISRPHRDRQTCRAVDNHTVG
jgi:hypothetical protein